MQRTNITNTTLSMPLSISEYYRLRSFLHQTPGAMNLETMDGFFTALICLPQTETVNSVFSLVWGSDASFKTDEEACEITHLIMRHWNTIQQTLKKGDYHYPLLLEDKNGMVYANDWAQGFNMGMQFIYKDWSNALNDQAYLKWILPILALAHEHPPAPERRPIRIDNAQRQKLLSDLVIGVKKIHDYFLPHPSAAGYKTKQPEVSIIRRKEFDLSGSERKYKHRYGNKTDRSLYSRTLH